VKNLDVVEILVAADIYSQLWRQTCVMRSTIFTFAFLIVVSACSTSSPSGVSDLKPPKVSTKMAESISPRLELDSSKIVESPTLIVMAQHPTLQCLNSSFDKFIDVFGMYVIGTPGAPLGYVEHTANVLAQYIDNDEDGFPDDSKVLSFLVDDNYVVPVWNESDRDPFFEGIRGTYCEDNLSMAASMYYEYDQWAIGGIEKQGTWDTNLEEVWHVVSVGWYNSYPTYFGDSPGTSKLTAAMDLARGGQFETIPASYPRKAWYRYYDETCSYGCQVHEYFYWLLMANIGALEDALTSKCQDVEDEWYLCTKAQMEETDALAFDLFNNQGFNLPTNIPDGSYQSQK